MPRLPPIANPSNGSEDKYSALSFRNAASTPPWTTAYIACRRTSLQVRRAGSAPPTGDCGYTTSATQRLVVDVRTAGSSSSGMMMSAPSALLRAHRELSGVSSTSFDRPGTLLNVDARFGDSLRSSPSALLVLARDRRRLHLGAVLPRLRRVSQGEDLEPAAVRDDRRVAADERVQTSRVFDRLDPRLEHQVVRVAEHQVQAGVCATTLVRHRLERGVGADGDERGGVDRPVRRVDAAHARGRLRSSGGSPRSGSARAARTRGTRAHGGGVSGSVSGDDPEDSARRASARLTRNVHDTSHARRPSRRGRRARSARGSRDGEPPRRASPPPCRLSGGVIPTRAVPRPPCSVAAPQ